MTTDFTMTSSCCECAHYPYDCDGDEGCKPRKAEELEPCPCCGPGGTYGHPRVFTDTYKRLNHTTLMPFWESTTECWDCNLKIMRISVVSKEEAERLSQEAWNTRYKRTCQMERFDPYVQGLKCSECGIEVEPFIDTIDSSFHSPYKFCPNCGAEVADGD